MSIPKAHHYLPKWYLARWAKDGQVWEFRRRGPTQALVKKRVAPRGTAYEPNLYSPSLETDFLQIIDDRGAKALSMAEQNKSIAGPSDKGGLVQFVVSMIHRSPGRINFLQKRLEDDLSNNELFSDVETDYFRNYALEVFADLVGSDQINGKLFDFKIFNFLVGQGGFDLLTSDRPVLISNGLHHRSAFVLMPSSPSTFLVLAAEKETAIYFASQKPKVLSKAINDAVVRQAEGLVIANTDQHYAFVDNRLRRADADSTLETSELVKWQF